MRSAHYVVIKKDQTSFVSKIKLEHNMQFGKEEGVQWLTEKHDVESVTYISVKTCNELYSAHSIQDASL